MNSWRLLGNFSGGCEAVTLDGWQFLDGLLDLPGGAVFFLLGLGRFFLCFEDLSELRREIGVFRCDGISHSVAQFLAGCLGFFTQCLDFWILHRFLPCFLESVADIFWKTLDEFSVFPPFSRSLFLRIRSAGCGGGLFCGGEE